MVQVSLEASLSEFQKGYLEGYKDALTDVSEDFYKPQNRPTDEGKTTAWVNMPEAEEKSVADLFRDMEKLKDDFFEQITRLQGNLCQVERRVDKIENGRV